MEAGIVYNCLEANEVVSPISFYKGIVKPPIETVEAYKVLEEILITEGSHNPYATLLFHQDEDPYQDPYLDSYEVYQEGNATTKAWNTGLF